LTSAESYTAKSGNRKGSLERNESLYYKDAKRQFWKVPKSQRNPQILQATKLKTIAAARLVPDRNQRAKSLVRIIERQNVEISILGLSRVVSV
jgi:hypothetical protein